MTINGTKHHLSSQLSILHVQHATKNYFQAVKLC